MAQEQRKEAFEMATAQAYQTVRVFVMSKTKKGYKLPKFSEVLGGSVIRVDQFTSPAKAQAALQMMAARAGTKAKRGDGR